MVSKLIGLSTIIALICFLYYGFYEKSDDAEPLERVAYREAPLARSNVNAAEQIPRGGRPVEELAAYRGAPDRGAGNSGSFEDYEMSLLALFQTFDQRLASAVILVHGAGAYRYAAGDYVVEDLYLQAILPDRVLLRYKGDIHVLELDSLALNEPLPTPSTLSERVESDLPDDQERFLTEAQRQRLAFLKHVDIHPVTEGVPAGYIVGNKFPEEASVKTGILAGDVVLSVNGYPVGDEASDTLVWRSFQQTGKGTLMISREGRQIIIDFEG